MTIVVIGLDTSKNWFQVHGVDASGQVLRRKLPRPKVLAFFANLPRAIIGLEACGGAHHWARELAALGDEPCLMPARYVRPYVKGNKHDAADAEACWAAVQRPGMRFVATKTVDQQAVLILHRTREVRRRTGAINALRGQMGEFGTVTAKGSAKARELMALVASEERIPALAREALHQLVEQIRDTERRIEELDRQIPALAKANPVARRLMTIPSIGPYAATAIVAMVSDAQQFASARHFAAWLGLGLSQHSTGGKERIGRISKRGDSYVRRLLIHGARGVVHRVRAGQVKGAWIAALLARRPFNVATVALANKTARIAWAVMSKGEAFRAAG